MFSERILRAQSGSQEDMLFIIQKFEPQLKHYSRRLHSEDAQSELTLRFIETIHAMNLDSLRSQGDGTIVAYLAQSVRNAYISLLPFKKTVEPPVSWEELTEAQLLGLVAPIREREVLDFSELLDTCPELTKKGEKSPYPNLPPWIYISRYCKDCPYNKTKYQSGKDESVKKASALSIGNSENHYATNSTPNFMPIPAHRQQGTNLYG